MLNLLGGMARATVGVALLPIDAVVDLATLGGTLNDAAELQTAKRCRQIGRALDDALAP